MQFGEDPSISHVANRFMGTGLFKAPLPAKLSRPLLSAMVSDAGGTVRHPAAGRETGNRALRPYMCLYVCVSAKKQPSRVHVHAVTVPGGGRCHFNLRLEPGGSMGVLCAMEVMHRDSRTEWTNRGVVVPTTLLLEYDGWLVPTEGAPMTYRLAFTSDVHAILKKSCNHTVPPLCNVAVTVRTQIQGKKKTT